MQLIEIQKKYGIGLTGGIASGKSTVAQMIRKFGYDVIDADELAKIAVRPGSLALAKIVDCFGGKILNEDSTLNRKMLANLIFRDSGLKSKLEAIVHPAIQKELDSKVSILGLYDNPRTWFYEATLLFETGSFSLYSEVWLVYCNPQTQIERLKKRNHSMAHLAQDIISSQLSNEEKLKKSKVAISTECSLDELEKRVNTHLFTMRTLTQSQIRKIP